VHGNGVLVGVFIGFDAMGTWRRVWDPLFLRGLVMWGGFSSRWFGGREGLGVLLIPSFAFCFVLFFFCEADLA
jgi:hypothetical protein